MPTHREIAISVFSEMMGGDRKESELRPELYAPIEAALRNAADDALEDSLVALHEVWSEDTATNDGDKFGYRLACRKVSEAIRALKEGE